MKQVGTLTVAKPRDIEQRGETACNYTITRIKPGTYPVTIEWYNGRRVLRAVIDGSLIKSHYENRVFTACSVVDQEFNEGDKPTQYMWSWGYHNYFSCPFENADDFGQSRFCLRLDGVVIEADPRGHYDHGRPIIHYTLKDRETATA